MIKDCEKEEEENVRWKTVVWPWNFRQTKLSTIFAIVTGRSLLLWDLDLTPSFLDGFYLSTPHSLQKMGKYRQQHRTSEIEMTEAYV